jgi:hypothetical protein
MPDAPNAKKKIKANAVESTDSLADERASLAGATHEAPPRCIHEKRQIPPKEQTSPSSTREESPEEGRRPSVRLRLPERESGG